jgi:hypothetical protein
MAVSTQDRLRPPQTSGPWVESPFFERELEPRNLTDDQRRIASEFHTQGYVTLEQVVPHELVDRVHAETASMLEEPLAVEQRRVQDAWKRTAASTRELATAEPILSVLRTLYERTPIPFQTLNFKWGTEQPAHADAIHFSCLPARFMCGVWVALEDVDAGNGPLFYYPGSHRLAELTTYDLDQTVETSHDKAAYELYVAYQEELMDQLGLRAIEFHARKGDALIWSSNIVHGGRPITEAGRTRWSQVTHYYFDSCVYYTPVFSDMAMGELLLKDIVDITNQQSVAHSFNGRRVWTTLLPSGLSRISLSPNADREALKQASVRITDLERELEAARADAHALRRSLSFRLGHGLLSPLRAARRRLASRG